MGPCAHTDPQDVVSNGGTLLARICRMCAEVICKDCGRRAFWPDSDARARALENDPDDPIRFCRCRPYTKRFANRKPRERDAG